MPVAMLVTIPGMKAADYDRVAQSDADVLGQVKSSSHKLTRLRAELASRAHACTGRAI